MVYSHSKNIKSNFEQSEAKIVNALTSVGFGVLTEINIKNAFKSKLDLDYKNYNIVF